MLCKIITKGQQHNAPIHCALFFFYIYYSMWIWRFFIHDNRNADQFVVKFQNMYVVLDSHFFVLDSYSHFYLKLFKLLLCNHVCDRL